MKKNLSLLFLLAIPFTTLAGCTNSHTHVLDLVEEVKSNCEVEGFLAHYECQGCDELFNLDKKIVQIASEEIQQSKTVKIN